MQAISVTYIALSHSVPMDEIEIFYVIQEHNVRPVLKKTF